MIAIAFTLMLPLVGRVRSWAKLMSDLTYAEVLNCGSRFKNTAPKQQRSAYNFFMLFVQSIMEKDFIEKKRIQSQEVMRGIGSLWSSLNPRDRKVSMQNRKFR